MEKATKGTTMPAQSAATKPVVFFGTFEDVDYILLLSDGTSVGFSSKDASALYEQILDLEGSDLEVIGRFTKGALSND